MLCHWNRVEYNRGYGPGNIIVEADTVREAREIAVAHAQRAIHSDDNSWRDETEKDTLLDVVRADLAKEPVIVESGVVFIRGSD